LRSVAQSVTQRSERCTKDFKDFSDTNTLEEGARLTALLKKAKIKDFVQANQKAIDSGMYETSEASEASDDLPKGAGLSESSDYALGDPPLSSYGGKIPRPWIRALIDKNRKEKQRQEQVATGNKGRGKVGITYDHPLVHKYDDQRSSGNNSSQEDIFSTPSDAGSKKRRIQSIPRQERLSRKSRKSEKEKSIYASREMQKKIEEKSMINLDLLGFSSHEADRITKVKIDVMRMEEPNSQERVRDTDSEWVDVLVNTFDVERKHEYMYQTIGGNHSRTAFARLLDTVSIPPTHI
jgi:hypothetical protein